MELLMYGACYQPEERLRLYAKVFENTSEGIMITDATGHIISVNLAFTKTTGYREEEVAGQTARILHSGVHDKVFYDNMWNSLLTHSTWKGEIWNKRKNGEIYPERLTINAVRDAGGQVTNYIGVFSDITEKKRSEEELEYLAHYDVVTGLPNRTYFQKQLEHEINDAELTSQQVAILFIDLDRFKYVNDTLGHNFGDKILKEVGLRLSTCIREQDTLSRLGGDEFTVILPQISSPEEVLEVGRMIVSEINRPFHIEGHDIFLTSSTGISIYPSDGLEGDTLINNADTAMYRAKEIGNHMQLYTTTMNQYYLRRMELEKGLYRALSCEQFEVYYQPQISMQTNRIWGMEALIRWNHPEWGMISPKDFIPLAEENGLIVEIGQWVFRQVCKQLSEWNGRGLPLYKISVNLSVRQLHQSKLVQILKKTLQDYCVNPSYITIEITESISLHPIDSILRILTDLKKIGVSLALDDFGVGHSSFAYLRKYPIDILKIDKSFMKDLEDRGNIAIMKAIIEMSHGLSLKVVAEGVETDKQYGLLKQLGCDVIQGYYFSRPVPSEEIEISFLKDNDFSL